MTFTNSPRGMELVDRQIDISWRLAAWRKSRGIDDGQLLYAVQQRDPMVTWEQISLFESGDLRYPAGFLVNYADAVGADLVTLIQPSK